MAVAMADGELRRSEKGVLQGLAHRVGLGQVTFDAMLERAAHDKTFGDDLSLPPPKAHTALKLLVATARIDGHISEEERAVIVHIAGRLGITGEDFERTYLEGIGDADAVRRSHER